MGHFQALPDVVAVAADRLVVILRVETDGSVVVRDLANGELSTTSASELNAPPSLAETSAPALTSIVQATDAQWERARRREAVIANLAKAPDPAEQVTRASARLGVSRRTVFRWLAAYRKSPPAPCVSKGSR
jgi:transcriptional regulator of acetoin/glycerol metabolism